MHTVTKVKRNVQKLYLVGIEPTTCSRRETYWCLNPFSHWASYHQIEYFKDLNYFKNRSTLEGPKGQEWTKMDARLVLTFVLELDLPCVASGGPIFAGLRWDLRSQASQDKEFWRKLVLSNHLKSYFHICTLDLYLKISA